MFLLCALLVLVACAYGQQTDPDMDAWNAHLDVELQKLWITLDYNRNGGYDLHDIHQFMRDYDTNGDHQVSADEFYVHFDMSEPALARVHTGLFNEYDDNQDGAVTASDLEAMYNRMDLDKDGTIAKAEFIEFYREVLTMLYLLQLEPQ